MPHLVHVAVAACAVVLFGILATCFTMVGRLALPWASQCSLVKSLEHDGEASGIASSYHP
jgi:hypothetical protein